MEIKFRKGYSKPKGFWYVEVTSDGDTVDAGFVMKSIVNGKWQHSKSEEQYRTRREATNALVMFATVELAAVKHYANATSTDPERSFYQGEIYQASKRALIDAIQTTYPDMDATEVYSGWVDSGESIGHVVERIRQERREFQAYLDAEHAEANEEDADRAGHASAAALEAALNPENANGGVIDVVDDNHVIIVSFGTALPMLAIDSDKPYRFTTRDGLPAAWVAVNTRGMFNTINAPLFADMAVEAYQDMAATKGVPVSVTLVA